MPGAHFEPIVASDASFSLVSFDLPPAPPVQVLLCQGSAQGTLLASLLAPGAVIQRLTCVGLTD